MSDGPTPAPMGDSASTAIEVRNLVKGYKGVPVLHDVSFSVRHMMVSNVRGEFGSVHGTIAFDDQDASRSTIEATIDATTINTRVSGRDEDLKSPSFFDVAKFPTATLKLTGPIALGTIPPVGASATYTAVGDLTMHGVTRSVSFPLKAERRADGIYSLADVPIVFANWGIPNPDIQQPSKADREG